jgi:hypothetical protein
LIVDYDKLINASKDFTEDELRRIRKDEDVKKKLHKNPIKGFLLRLVSLLTTDSQEYLSSEKEKGAFSGVVPSLPSTSTPDLQSSSSALPSTPPYSHGPLPVANESGAVDHKRKLSQTSIETRSTETTPAKLVQPEDKVQSLQHTFINNIVDHLWLGEVGIPWAKGRRMFLTYTE